MSEIADGVRAASFAIAALMPIVNPLGSAPIFLSMTADLPTPARRVLPRRVAWNSFLLLSAAMLTGSPHDSDGVMDVPAVEQDLDSINECAEATRLDHANQT